MNKVKCFKDFLNESIGLTLIQTIEQIFTIKNISDFLINEKDLYISSFYQKVSKFKNDYRPYYNKLFGRLDKNSLIIKSSETNGYLNLLYDDIKKLLRKRKLDKKPIIKANKFFIHDSVLPYIGGITDIEEEFRYNHLIFLDNIEKNNFIERYTDSIKKEIESYFYRVLNNDISQKDDLKKHAEYLIQNGFGIFNKTDIRQYVDYLINSY